HLRGDRESYDLVDLLLSHVDEETGQPLRTSEIHDELVTTLLAGYETTATSLSWTLYEVAEHPDVRDELEREVDDVLGDRVPSREDLPRLPYTRMVVDESLRLYPPIWGFPRDAIRDDQMGGFTIPGGSSVLLLPYVTHRHPAYWPEPDRFNPANFTTEKI